VSGWGLCIWSIFSGLVKLLNELYNCPSSDYLLSKQKADSWHKPPLSRFFCFVCCGNSTPERLRSWKCVLWILPGGKQIVLFLGGALNPTSCVNWLKNHSLAFTVSEPRIVERSLNWCPEGQVLVSTLWFGASLLSIKEAKRDWNRIRFFWHSIGHWSRTKFQAAIFNHWKHSLL
jgi:hypothetical protein